MRRRSFFLFSSPTDCPLGRSHRLCRRLSQLDDLQGTSESAAGDAGLIWTSQIAADLNKPDGQFVVDPTPKACMAFMRDLPIRRVPGIGRVRCFRGLVDARFR